MAAGQVFDGGNRRYDILWGGQGEVPPPVFVLEEGATLRNVIIGSYPSDGIHCHGNCTLERVWWENVDYGAFRALGPVGSTASINCGGAYGVSENVFRNYGRGDMRVSNFYASNGTRLYKSCGDCTNNGSARNVSLTNIVTRDIRFVASVNKNYGDRAILRNLIIDNTTALSTDVCRVYLGVVKGQGTSTFLGVEWGTTNCNVNPSDVTVLPPSTVTLPY